MGLAFLGRLELRSEYRDMAKPTVLKEKSVLEEYRNVIKKSTIALKAEN
jgi:hypothetical protein